MEAIKEISGMLDDMLNRMPSRRDYNAVFEKISSILTEKYSHAIPPLDLRFRFTLFMQEEFDAVPKEEWKVNDDSWLASIEHKAKEKLLQWIEQEIV